MNNPKAKLTDRSFFVITAVFFLLVNIIGFSHSINSKIAKEGALHSHVYMHGIFASIWVLLYFVQTVLISSKNQKLHIQLGKLGLVILILVLLSGFYAAFMVPVIYEAKPPYVQAPRDFSAIILVVILGALGLKYKNNAFVHKRMMMICTLLLSSAGIARTMIAFGVIGSFGPFIIISSLFLPVIAMMIYDYITYKKVFKVDWIGILSICLLFVISTPPVWKNPVIQPFITAIVQWLS